MSSSDDDIRSDFLAEAGELVEQLATQLMALERNPQDSELLNAVIRAFHTVKGGAGFLQLPALVELCHAAEDVLNAVRGQRRAFDDEVDRKSVVEGKGVSVSVDIGGVRIIYKKTQRTTIDRN